METPTIDQHQVSHTAPGNSTAGKAKIIRTRKPWVYKAKYDRLERKYTILKWVALIGWLSFAIALKFT